MIKRDTRPDRTKQITQDDITHRAILKPRLTRKPKQDKPKGGANGNVRKPR